MVGGGQRLGGREDLDACLARADRSLYNVKQSLVPRVPEGPSAEGRLAPSLLAST